MEIRTTRFSGADWATEIHPVLVVGCGGIGSWTVFNLARIGHDLTIFDGDSVDQTNVHGGQMFRTEDIDIFKTFAIRNICLSFGCISQIDPVPHNFVEGDAEMHSIIITGLDNMAARRLVYEDWKRHLTPENSKLAILIDGRLTMEMYEVFTIRGTDLEAMEVYEKEYLFSDEEAQELDCTTKQSTFGAMKIGGSIAETLCNHLTNVKLNMDFREVPGYQRWYGPMMDYRKSELKLESCQQQIKAPTVEQEESASILSIS